MRFATYPQQIKIGSDLFVANVRKTKKNTPKPCDFRVFMVETTGLEPVTSCV